MGLLWLLGRADGCIGWNCFLSLVNSVPHGDEVAPGV